ncbi:MAG: WYL domain-containing protein [Planctomycetes bacterium]|jgi:predicted DNA-binding transcriptional regulator YafY|nr:WYL domain-containing protein [Planctomycetota bacterium]
MRRADRLFQIVHLLRRDRATTAAWLARELEVSERTIYRDVQDLMASGVPIQGEAGVGYALPARFDLPPLMFRAVELEALVLGARMVQGWADDELQRAARAALAKVERVLPPALATATAANKLFVPDFHLDASSRALLQPVRQALAQQRVLRLDYADERGDTTVREVRPLGLFCWGKVWTLVGWCELREDFRSFRIDRMRAAVVQARGFVDEAGRQLDDFLAGVADEPPELRQRRVTARPDERAAKRAFQQLGSVGPACAGDLVQLGFRTVDELRGQDPRALWLRLSELTGARQDPCVEDTFRCVIAQAEHPDLPAKWRRWHHWTPLRGQPPGALPPELRRRRK